MGTVEDAHLGIAPPAFTHGPDLGGDPVGFKLVVFRVEIQGLLCIRADGGEGLVQPVPVFGNEGVAGRQNLGRGAVVGVQENGLRAGMAAFKFQDEFHIRAPPGIDGLVRVAHHEEVAVVARQDIRQGILVLVDVLKFVHHDVFEPLLPFPAGELVPLQDVQGEVHQVIEIQAVALTLFIKIAVHDLVLQGVGGGGQVVEMAHIHVDEGLHIPPPALAPADVVDGILDGHVPAGEPQVLEDGAQDRCLVLLVQDDEGTGILDHMAVLFE